MEPKQNMNKTIKHILHDIDHIGAVVRQVEEELVTAHPLNKRKVLILNEKLGEIHARLDGMREFVINCQRQAREEPIEHEIDVWL